MVVVNINSSNDIINSILITGHSGYEKIGKDIVCSAISSITITTINAILRFDDGSIDYIQTDDLEIKIKKHTKEVDILIDNMLNLLKELECQYSNYLKIVKKESHK